MDGLIGFKEAILDDVLQGRMFTINYPLLIEHIIREARLYRKFVEQLEREGALPKQSMCEMERFWNRIMMEHAMFIRGLLDPCETELFGTADDFAKCFCELLDASRCAHDKTLETTAKFRDFKAAGYSAMQNSQCHSAAACGPCAAGSESLPSIAAAIIPVSQISKKLSPIVVTAFLRELHLERQRSIIKKAYRLNSAGSLKGSNMIVIRNAHCREGS